MLLLIFESIGTSELILIGIIALIFLGPRKLPQIARTIGKTVSDLRNTTNEFKATWQREVDFEEEARALRTGELSEDKPDSIARDKSIRAETPTESPAEPTVREIDAESFGEQVPEAAGEPAGEDRTIDELSDKRTWL